MLMVRSLCRRGIFFMPDITKVKFGNDFWIYLLSLSNLITGASVNEKLLPALTNTH